VKRTVNIDAIVRFGAPDNAPHGVVRGPETHHAYQQTYHHALGAVSVANLISTTTGGSFDSLADATGVDHEVETYAAQHADPVFRYEFLATLGPAAARVHLILTGTGTGAKLFLQPGGPEGPSARPWMLDATARASGVDDYGDCFSGLKWPGAATAGPHERGYRAEHGVVEQIGLAGPHPLQAVHQHLLEPPRLELSDTKLESAAGDDQPRRERVVSSAAALVRDLSRDQLAHFVGRPPNQGRPCPLILNEAAHCFELARAERHRAASGRKHQPTQLIRALQAANHCADTRARSEATR